MNLESTTFTNCCTCSIGGFAGSDEAPLLERMIEAYRERNEEEFEQCCDDITFRTMDNEVVCNV